jgi:hypothetical protein
VLSSNFFEIRIRSGIQKVGIFTFSDRTNQHFTARMQRPLAALQAAPAEPAADTLVHLSPCYSLEDVLAVRPASSDPQLPADLQHVSTVYIREPQLPESLGGPPQTADINSTSKTRRPARGSWKSVLEREPADSELWYYQDPLGRVMGPYTPGRMRTWLTKRYFDANLAIARTEAGPFRPFAVVFPEPTDAFEDDLHPFRERTQTLFSFSQTDTDDAAWGIVGDRTGHL